jgi:hypothetical protein
MTHADAAQRPSYGVTAVLLLRLEARIGEWVAADDLASHFQLTLPYVLFNLEALADSGDVEVQRTDGTIRRARIAARAGAGA